MVRSREKVVFVLVDGLGDVTLPAFGDRTPLEVAHVPTLDAIAAAGLNGLMDPVEPGLACGSDTAHMSLFGYDPRSFYRGRGAFESMGAGIHMQPGDIAFKCNFATLDVASGVVLSRRADRDFEHLGPTLCAALDGLAIPGFPEHSVAVKYATEHRCGVMVRGPGLTDAISGTDPLKDKLPLLSVEPLDGSPEAKTTAAVINALSGAMQRVLEGHAINVERKAQGLAPANVVLLRGCGCRIKVPSFAELHHMRPCLVAPTKIIAGLGMSFDIDSLEATGATGSYDSALHSKARTICDALTGAASAGAPGGGAGAEDGGQDEARAETSGAQPDGGYQFGFVHVKAVDDTGHDRMVEMKVRFQEAVDRMLGQVVRRLWEAERAGSGRYTLVVTGDHSTPVLFGDHSHEPVPFAIAHVRHVVQAMGGEEAVSRVSLGPIQMPSTKAPPPLAQLQQQGLWQDARRKSSWAGRPWIPGMPAEVFGPWQEPWPQAVRGDPVRSFDEVSAARGGLGRFPGSEVMPLIKRFAGVGP